MTTGTAVPSPTFGPQGFIPPAETAVLAGVTADLNAAFGGNLNPSPATPQGQMATSLAAMIGAVNDQFLLYTNLVDPALSSGRMQDAIGRFYFLSRIPSAPTVVAALCIGQTGVSIPSGALAQATDGNVYVCTAGDTFPASGQLTLPFACQVPGPIACSAGMLTTIYQAIPGWDSISNPTAGVLGNLVETAQAFEARRSASVAQNSLGWLAGVVGAVWAVPGVLSVFAAENDTNSPASFGGVTLNANSIYVCVEGGAAQAVARAIWTHKSPGCPYTGDTLEIVYDTNPLYQPPYPAYSVYFETAKNLPFVVAVSIANNAQVPSNAATLVSQAIVNAFAGVDGGPRAAIGAAQFASRYYATIAALWPGVRIVSILLGSTNLTVASATGSITGTTMTVTAVASGALAPGQSLFDAGGAIISGTTIVNQLTGTTGGTGTYTVSASQTVTSEAILAVVATQFEVPVNVNQIPVVSAANVTLTLI